MTAKPPKLIMRRKDLAELPDFPTLPVGTRLRRADFPDAPGLARVLASAFADERWTPGLVHRLLLDAPDVVAVFVVEVDGVACATASARLLPERFPHCGYVHWVGTHAGAAGRGLARLANLAVLHEFVRQRCTAVVLETDDVRLAAIRMYHGLGFRPEMTEPCHPARWEAVLAQLESAR